VLPAHQGQHEEHGAERSDHPEPQGPVQEALGEGLNRWRTPSPVDPRGAAPGLTGAVPRPRERERPAVTSSNGRLALGLELYGRMLRVRKFEERAQALAA